MICNLNLRIYHWLLDFARQSMLTNDRHRGN